MGNILRRLSKQWNSIAATIGIALFASVIVASPFFSGQAQALNHHGTYYFSGNGGYLGSSECNIKSDGYHAGADPNSFIAAVREAEARPYNYNCSGLDQIGARYVVYTILGRGVQYNEAKKWERISSADWTEFERRIRATTMENQARTYRQNGCLSSATSYYREDVNQFSVRNADCDDSYSAVVFKVNGNIVYIIDRACMNPIGDYVGPPSYDYNLTPSVDSVSPSSSEGSGSAQIGASVNNSGSSNTSTVSWQSTTFQVAPGGTIPSGGDSGTSPTAFYGNSALVIASGSQVFVKGTNTVNISDQTFGDLPVGTRVCYTLSVQPITQSNGNWRHGTPRCLVISKKPKVQILGGDLIVAQGSSISSDVRSSTTTKTVSGVSRTYGSWVEYGIVAPGLVSGMASGAGYSGGATSANICGISLLTFANAGSTTCSPSTILGGYAATRAQPDIGSRFAVTKPPLGANPTINLGTMANGVYSGTGNITISASSIAKGRWVVINAPTATVTISGNMTYFGGPLQTMTDIPQVVIIANRIDIQGGVGQVDAWLVARGTTGSIYTCSDYAQITDLTANRCQNQLYVNGPVVTQHLYLYRTAGAEQGTQTGKPAEIFNLRPDAYLWATGYSLNAGRLQTVSTKELPPRF